jgi:hypothetical protein
MQTLLLQNRNPDLRAYFIWGPYLHADNLEIARVNSDRFYVPNASFFWTPTPALAQDLAKQLSLPSGQLGWDVYLVYGKGALWDKNFPMPAYWAHQIDVIQGEPLDMQKFEARILQLLKQK